MGHFVQFTYCKFLIYNFRTIASRCSGVPSCSQIIVESKLKIWGTNKSVAIFKQSLQGDSWHLLSNMFENEKQTLKYQLIYLLNSNIYQLYLLLC